MSDTFADTLPPVDHNLPPEPVEAAEEAPLRLIMGPELEQYLNETYCDNLERAAALLIRGKDFLVIKNDQDDEEATEFLVKLRACWKTAENARTAEKDPYDVAAGTVHSFFKSNILDPLGLAPTFKGHYDPLEHPDLGLGPRVSMAQSLFKLAKAEKERKEREESARLARKAEEDAARARALAEAKAREEEAARRRAAEEAEAKAREEARQAELTASRARNEANRVAAEAEAAERRRLADLATAKRLEDQRIADEARELREREARDAENRIAEERAAAEAAAAVPLADLSRARGERGGVSSLRTSVAWRDVSRETLDLEALRPYFKDTAFEQAIKAYLDSNKATVQTHLKNGTQPIKGCVIYLYSHSASRA